MTSESDIAEKYYGEPLKYDKNFKGPLSNRSCTDIICLLIFIVFLGCWGGIGWYAITKGDLDRLLVPTDTQNRKCGVDTDVIDKPYLVFFNLAKCIDPMVPITGCPTPQVCVNRCPTESFFFNNVECMSQGAVEYRKKLICDSNTDLNRISTCNDIQTLIDSESCAQWYLQSEPFLKRCISALPTTVCPRIPAKYLSRQSRDTTYQMSSNNNNNNYNKNQKQLTQSNGAAADEIVQCEKRRQLGEQMIMDKVRKTDTILARFVGNVIAHISNTTDAQEVGQMIVEDVITSWWQILIALVMSMIICLIFIILMRWLAAPLIWFSIIGVIAMLGYGIYYSATMFIYYRDNPPPSTGVSPNLNSLVKSWLAQKDTWMYILIILSIILFIILLIILVLRARIIIAIALVKEGSKAVSSTTSSVFFPIFPWILQVGVIIYAVIIGLYLASVGEQIYQVTGLDKATCVCTGPALNYENGAICDPFIFNQNCHTTSTSILPFLRQGSTDDCTQGCQFKEIQHPTVIPYFQAINVIGFFWVVFFISALGEMVLAATFATWYWTFHKSNVPFFTLTVGLGRTVRYHLGTLAFGSLIITICRIIRVILEYIDRKLKKYDNAVTRAIMCCLKCFFWMLESFLKFLNKNAYIMCAIHGKHFCASAKDAFNLLMRNFLRVIALDKVTEFLFFLTKVLATVGIGALSYLYFSSDKTLYPLHYNLVPVIIVMIGTYLIATVFFGVYSMAVDTLFLCFLEDCERNDGSPEKPYFMSKQLMKILGKKNAIPRHEYN